MKLNKRSTLVGRATGGDPQGNKVDQGDKVDRPLYFLYRHILGTTPWGEPLR